MSDLLKNIDERSRLAGTNKLEILMFSVGVDSSNGRRATFGINVFKVREVMRAPEITRAPEMPAAVEGMVSLRGELVPVIDLRRHLGIQSNEKNNILIVAEYNGQVQGLLVHEVDTILRLDWASMKVPPAMLGGGLASMVTAVTELKDGRLVMMLDVEKILVETSGEDKMTSLKEIQSFVGASSKTIFFADDSFVARKQIAATLDAMGVNYRFAVNGSHAWADLSEVANQCEADGKAVKDVIQLILTDVEMPEMDGYMLTRKIKADKRFTGVPVLMHSSLSGTANHQLGKAIGVDEYIPKFEPQKLSQAIIRILS